MSLPYCKQPCNTLFESRLEKIQPAFLLHCCSANIYTYHRKTGARPVGPGPWTPEVNTYKVHQRCALRMRTRCASCLPAR